MVCMKSIAGRMTLEASELRAARMPSGTARIIAKTLATITSDRVSIARVHIGAVAKVWISSMPTSVARPNFQPRASSPSNPSSTAITSGGTQCSAP